MDERKEKERKETKSDPSRVVVAFIKYAAILIVFSGSCGSLLIIFCSVYFLVNQAVVNRLGFFSCLSGVVTKF